MIATVFVFLYGHLIAVSRSEGVYVVLYFWFETGERARKTSLVVSRSCSSTGLALHGLFIQSVF